jgi:hypothetical protein
MTATHKFPMLTVSFDLPSSGAANAKVDRPRIRRLAAWQVRSASGHAVPPRAELHEERITNGAT